MQPILHVVHVGKVVSENERLEFRRAKGEDLVYEAGKLKSKSKKGHAYPNPDYQVFKDTLAWEIKAAMGYCPPWPFPFKGPVKIRVDATLPAAMDVANIMKPLLDAVAIAGAVLTDNQFRRLLVEGDNVCGRGEEPRLEFWIEEIGRGDHGYPDPW